MKIFFCPICNRHASKRNMRKIAFRNLKGIICKDCFREIVRAKKAGT